MALFTSSAADANGLRRPSFQELMADSALVVIGRVEAIHSRTSTGQGWATISVLNVLKGDHASVVTVRTTHPVFELDPHCCEMGATYMMFLRPSTLDSTEFMSVRGAYGIVWLGAGDPSGPGPVLQPDG